MPSIGYSSRVSSLRKPCLIVLHPFAGGREIPCPSVCSVDDLVFWAQNLGWSIARFDSGRVLLLLPDSIGRSTGFWAP